MLLNPCWCPTRFEVNSSFPEIAPVVPQMALLYFPQHIHKRNCSELFYIAIVLKISKNFQENIQSEIIFIVIITSHERSTQESSEIQKQPKTVKTVETVTFHRPATLLKKKLWHRRFPVNFTKLTLFFIEQLGWLLLEIFRTPILGKTCILLLPV